MPPPPTNTALAERLTSLRVGDKVTKQVLDDVLSAAEAAIDWLQAEVARLSEMLGEVGICPACGCSADFSVTEPCDCGADHCGCRAYWAAVLAGPEQETP